MLIAPDLFVDVFEVPRYLAIDMFVDPHYGAVVLFGYHGCGAFDVSGYYFWSHCRNLRSKYFFMLSFEYYQL